MSTLIELKTPDIGGSRDVNVAEVYVKPGDRININDNLLMLETDKATMEVPATASGIVKNISIKVNDKINEGDLILTLDADDIVNTQVLDSKIINPQVLTEEQIVVTSESINGGVALDKSLAEKSELVVNTESISATIDENQFAKAFASPSIRKLARELGVDLSKIKGTGNKGRITIDDVKGFVKSFMRLNNQEVSSGNGLDLLPWPKVDFSKFGTVEVKTLSRIKKISGANLARNWAMIPHVTQFDEADITELEEFRKELNEEYKKAGIKVTPLAFMIKASVYALTQFPEFNTSLDGDNLIYKKYINIGFAADTPNGLVVPVLKDANKKGIVDIAKETSHLANLAREGKLKSIDMQGGSFTISSLGGIGGTAFTPIINAPEVAILGISKSVIKPNWDGEKFIPRLMLPLSLSYDHRVIDGALAARFTTYLSKVLSDIRRLVL